MRVQQSVLLELFIERECLDFYLATSSSIYEGRNMRRLVNIQCEDKYLNHAQGLCLRVTQTYAGGP
jgi:hypothetical protein